MAEEIHVNKWEVARASLAAPEGSLIETILMFRVGEGVYIKLVVDELDWVS
jgi:hypothetical protein